MTRSRISVGRELFGILGPFSNGKNRQAEWNRFFREHGIDASMDRYRTTERNLLECLSEMYHFDRRGYLVSPALQERIIPLLDALDITAEQVGRVDTVVNGGGVLTGYCVGGTSVTDVLRIMY